MRRVFLIPLFLLPSLFTFTNSEDLSFCYGEDSICAVGNDLFALCDQYISTTDESWYQCLCGNGYISVDEQCHWCQLAYGLTEIYTDSTKEHCESVGIPIAPVPSSVLSVESNYNATYTGIISGAPNTAAPTDAAATTTDGGSGISVPPKTEDPSAAPTEAATTSQEDIYVVTQTVSSSTRTPTTTSASSQDTNNPVSKSSKGGLSTGAKAGIAIGSVLVAALIGALIWFGIVLSRIHKNKQLQQQQGQNFGPPGQVPQNQNPPGMAELGPGEGAAKPSFFGFYGRDNKPQSQTPAYVQNVQNQSPMQNHAPPYGQSPPMQNQSPPMQNTSPSLQNSMMSPGSQGRESSLGWPGGQTVSPTPSPGPPSPIPAAASYNQQSPPPQNQYPQQQPPPNAYQQQQNVYQAYNPPQQQLASELQGSYVQVPPGAGMPPDGRVG